MTRWPMYQGGQISGIMGYFFDEDMLSDGEDAARKSIEREPETGLNNVTHFLNSLGGLETEYAAVHRNFGILLIEIPKILRIQKRYEVSVQTEVPSGESWEALAWLQGLALRFSASCTATTIAERIQKRIDAINQVDGFSCTIFARVRILPAEEAVHFRQKLLRAVLQETDRE